MAGLTDTAGTAGSPEPLKEVSFEIFMTWCGNETSSFLRHLVLKTRDVCQDRLGTDIAKVENQRRFFITCRWKRSHSGDLVGPESELESPSANIARALARTNSSLGTNQQFSSGKKVGKRGGFRYTKRFKLMMTKLLTDFDPSKLQVREKKREKMNK